jgi:hypothetical protein
LQVTKTEDYCRHASWTSLRPFALRANLTDLNDFTVNKVSCFPLAHTRRSNIMVMDTELKIVVGDARRQLSVMSTGKPTQDILKSIGLFFQVICHHFRNVLASKLWDRSANVCYLRGSPLDNSG